MILRLTPQWPWLPLQHPQMISGKQEWFKWVWGWLQVCVDITKLLHRMLFLRGSLSNLFVIITDPKVSIGGFWKLLEMFSYRKRNTIYSRKKWFLAWTRFFIFYCLAVFQVQGAILVASLTQVLLGITGLIGFLMSRIGPLTIAPTITLVGLNLFGAAGDFAGKHWGISFL